MKLDKFLVYRLLLICWVVGILYISFISDPQRILFVHPDANTFFVLHFIAFFVLFILLYLSFKKRDKIAMLISLALALFLSIFKEYGQFFAAGRKFCTVDLAVDAFATFLAMSIIGLSKFLVRSRDL